MLDLPIDAAPVDAQAEMARRLREADGRQFKIEWEQTSSDFWSGTVLQPNQSAAPGHGVPVLKEQLPAEAPAFELRHSAGCRELTRAYPSRRDRTRTTARVRTPRRP